MKSPLRHFALPSFIATFFLLACAASLLSSPEKLSIDLPPTAWMGDAATVRVANGSPQIALKSGYPLHIAYEGTAAALSELEQNRAVGVSLASGDFDEDGMPDLIAGYSAPGGGIITLYRGNIDAIYPNSRYAKQRKLEGTFTDTPFLGPAKAFELTAPAEFLATGDFDGDKHIDIVAASSTDDALYWLRGNGKLQLNSVQRIPLPGKPTALIAGEINRMDTLNDLIVAVSAPSGPQVLVFEGAEGSLANRQPKSSSLPAAATAMALAHLDDDHYYDLAVSAGSRLIIIHGSGPANQPPKTTTLPLSFDAAGIAAGYFSAKSNQQHEMAVVSSNGYVQIFRRMKSHNHWLPDAELSMSSVVSGSKPVITRVRVSTYQAEDLAVFDGTSGNIALTNTIARNNNVFHLTGSGSRITAVLPMRLTPHALNSLVVLDDSGSAPSIMLATPNSIFTVTDPSDSGPGTLREAILLANQNPGLDEIHFQIGTGQQTIRINKKLPAIRDAVLIDGTTQPDGLSPQSDHVDAPLIVMDPLADNTDVYAFTSNSSSMRGIGIFNSKTALKVKSNFNLFERLYIGADETSAAGNATGLLIKGAVGNTIGGLTEANGVVISGNDTGVIVKGSGDTLFQYAFIGHNADGMIPIPNIETFLVKGSNGFTLNNSGVYSTGITGQFKNTSNISVQSNTFQGGTGTEYRKALSAALQSNKHEDQVAAILLMGKGNRDVRIDSNTYTNVGNPIISDPNPSTLSNATSNSVALSLISYDIQRLVFVEINAITPDGQQLSSIGQTMATTDINGNLDISIPYLFEVTSGSVTSTITPLCFSGITADRRNPSAAAADCKGNTTRMSDPVPINNAGNQPPDVSTPADLENTEGDVVTLQVIANDPENDPLTFGATGLPPNLTINPSSGLIAGIIADDTAGTYVVTLSVSDNVNPPVQVMFNWVVTANQPPTVTNPGDQVNNEGDSVFLEIDATDPEDDELTFSASNLPPGLSIDPATGIIFGSLPAGSSGTYNVTISVDDGFNDPVEIQFIWTVTAPAGNTFVVINTNDSGSGSLRQAILDSNNNGGGQIHFNIPGTGPFLISPAMGFPVVSAAVDIKGETQPGFAGVPIIFLSGAMGPPGFDGLIFLATGGSMSNIGIHSFPGRGLVLGGINQIINNWFGIDASGAPAGNGASAISLNSNAGGSSIIRNRIENNSDGIEMVDVVSGVQTAIYGNNILSNTNHGLYIENSSNILIGGITDLEGNVIGLNGTGVRLLQSSNIDFMRNFVGTDRDDTIDLGNIGAGLIAASGSNNIRVSKGVSAFNDKGVVVTSLLTPGVSVFETRFHDNTNLGVDLNDDGVTTNDTQDTDGGPNNLQNFIDIESVTTTFLIFTLNSTPNTTFRIDFYSSDAEDATGFGEGQRYIGNRMIGTNNDGDAGGTFAFPAPEISGNFISAIATDAAENSSEFSLSVVVP